MVLQVDEMIFNRQAAVVGPKKAGKTVVSDRVENLIGHELKAELVKGGTT